MSTILLLIVTTLLVLLFLITIWAVRRYEIMVCNEICSIYTNTLTQLDLLCGINNDIYVAWQKFCATYSVQEGRSYLTEKKLIEQIAFRKQEVIQMRNYPKLTFKESAAKSFILRKHKLSTQEIQAVVQIVDTFNNDMIGYFDSILKMLNTDQILQSGLSWVSLRSKCFQLEVNGIFYAALEGLCSFPSKSLILYEQERNRYKFLPTDVGLNRRKEDYLQLQELEYKKAQDLIKQTNELVQLDGAKVDALADTIFSQQINVFFSGSKALQTERDIFSNVINQLQTKWKDKHITIYGYSYQNFEHEFVINGHQCSYNDFIRRHSDIIFFVLNGSVGGKTKEELDVAIESFKSQRRPIIYVYSKDSDEYNEDVNSTRERIKEESQYWQDYSDNTHLRLLIQNDLTERLQKVYEQMIENQRMYIG